VRNEVRLRDVEGWWLGAGHASVTTAAASANSAMADITDGSGGSGALMRNAPDTLSDEARAGLEGADLGGLYLKLGIS
jgi:hypothetical protein